MKNAIGVLSLALAVGLAGCMTVDSKTGEKKVSSTTKGAGIGAAAGAVLGAATSSKKDRGKGALIGAAAGAALGGGVGNYQDRQESKLRERMAHSGVKVDRQGDTLNLMIPGNVSFKSGSAALDNDFYPVLDKVAVTLAEYPDTQVQVVGHTDNTGSGDLNQRLSKDRATAVALYLGSKGIQAGRMQAEGMGASMPVDNNDSYNGRARNRRVEIKIIPVAKAAS